MKIQNPPTSENEALKLLEQLEAEFSNWRKNKSSKRETIPIELLKAARSLSDHVGNKLVRSRLGISGAQLKRADKADTEQPQAFVQLETIDNKDLKVEMRMPNGAVITISGLPGNPMSTLARLLEQNHDLC